MPEAGLDIRRLQPDELPAYKNLRDTVLGAHPSAFTSDAASELARTPSSYRSRLGLDRPEGGHFTLAAWQGSMLFGALSCERDPRIKVRHIGHLTAMMVHDSAQRRGIGRALLAACLAEVRRTPDLSLLTLSVTDGNHAAQRLYERAGFQAYGRLDRAVCIAGQFHAKLLMSLTP